MNHRTTANTPDRLRSDLNLWLGSPLGGLLTAQERLVVAEELEDVFGEQLLQIGVWGEPAGFLRTARTQRQTVIAPDCEPGSQVHCKAAALPIASDSIDAVLLPHTLEFETDPYTLLREIDRILLADGRLLVLAFNPFGAWALRHRFSRHGFPPGMLRLISERRMRDWLALLGFEVTVVRRYMFRLPLTPRRVATTPARTEVGAERHWPLPAGAFLLKARKRVYTLTPVRPRWRESRSRVGGLVEPTTRMGS